MCISESIRSKLLGLMLVANAQSHQIGSDIQPEHESARNNAHIVFNTIHSAGRQWGSALQHNGFSFFPAIMPSGTLLYHGGRDATVPEHLEWLAFEVEHAAAFASSKMKGPGQPRKGDSKHDSDQKPLRRDKDDDATDDEPTKNIRGYLQTFQATRDLKLLFLDGMSAGKTELGTLDSQDLVLREGEPIYLHDEETRAGDICDILRTWGWDGFVRSEVGFEVIYCDFTSGMKQISSKRTFFHQDEMSNDTHFAFRWVREVGQRYDGLGGRLNIDYSSIVSGLFYAINISSTFHSRPDLSRLGAAKVEDLLAIKSHVAEMALQPRRFNVDWQQVVDMIVTRYSESIAIMASEDLSDNFFLTELERVTLVYVNAPSLEDDINAVPTHEEAVTDCRQHYLLAPKQAATEWSLEDDLIYTALGIVMEDICTTMFSIHQALLKVAPHPTFPHMLQDGPLNRHLRHAIRQQRHTVVALMERLNWTSWKKTTPCPLGETVAVAMWPFGSIQDHYHPGCRSPEDISWNKNSYWSTPVE